MVTTTNMADYTGVMLGRVHNVGAGGVSYNGGIDQYNINFKRSTQWLKRTSKSRGIINVVFTFNDYEERQCK